MPFRTRMKYTTQWSLRVLSLAGIGLIVGCSQGSGEATQLQPDFSQQRGDGEVVLSGPAPRTEEVQQFRIAVWDNVAPLDRCGECHAAGGQSPLFARADDINMAWEAANSIANLAQPALSPIVGKVAGGHNCWLSAAQACADIMTTWISNWAGEGQTGTALQLTAPERRAAGASKSFPVDAAGFAATVHPVLISYCSDCHRDDAAVPQAPFFSVADVADAYAAARSKISLDNPGASRLVRRLADEFHNCWTAVCMDDAAVMAAAIGDFAAAIPETELDPGLVTSDALALIDGVVASGGGRFDANVIARYEFKTLSGAVAYDTSGVDPALNLAFDGDVSWVGGWGIRVGAGGKAQGSTATSAKLHDLLTATGEYSIEFWAVPGNVTQEDARIVSYSGGTMDRNFSVQQTLYNYNFFSRSDITDAAGAPDLSTPDADEVLQSTLQHVVATFSPTAGRSLYVNGELITAAPQEASNLNDWDDTFALVLGNEVSGDRQWLGVLRFAAIHNRALEPAQIRRNYDAGVGEQFLLLFGVGDLVGVDDAYIIFEVSQFDSYSYLFGAPRYLSLSGTQPPSEVRLRGMRIGINGREPEVGQAFVSVDTLLASPAAGTEPQTGVPGQVLSPLGTVLGIEKGPEADEFFLSFDEIAGQFAVRVPAEVPLAAEPVDADPSPAVGIRTFDEISAAFAAMSGVPAADPNVQATFAAVRRQLPNTTSIDGFVSSQQMAVTQLAIEYCNAAVEDPARRAALFPGVDFGLAPATALAGPGMDALLAGLLQRVSADLGSQPEMSGARDELAALASRLADSDNSVGRTQTIAKSVCAAALGNAALLIQ